MSNESDLNYETTKELYASSKKSVRQMVRAVIRASPREVLIEILKDMKVIKAEYCAESDKLVMIERIKKSRIRVCRNEDMSKHPSLGVPNE